MVYYANIIIIIIISYLWYIMIYGIWMLISHYRSININREYPIMMIYGIWRAIWWYHYIISY